jgi:hypothetical protein
MRSARKLEFSAAGPKKRIPIIYSTFEGDLMRYSGRVVEKSPTPDDPWITCELEGTNQDGRQILTGRCTLVLPSRR